MRFLRPALAIFSALLAFTTAFTAWAREPTPEEIGELEALIDDGNLEAAAELRAKFFFDEIDGPAVDAQTMRLQYYQQDYDAAFSIANKLLSANPRHTMALNTRGLVKSQRGEILDALYRDDEALADFNRAFTKVDNVTQPMRSRSMALRSFIKLKRGDKAGATADFDRAIAYDATDPVGWFGRGSVALEARDYDAAIAAIGKAVEILPGNVLYSTMLGAAQKKGR